VGIRPARRSASKKTVDKAIVAPVAFAYKEVLPRPIRSGLRNFIKNLGEPIVFLNVMLQLKPGKAAETFGRFAINTAIGAAGLVDVAKRKPFNLPYRRNGFANTLGYYGVRPGPYFYLPLVGSTTLSDFIGNRLDQLILPMALGRSITRPSLRRVGCMAVLLRSHGCSRPSRCRLQPHVVRAVRAWRTVED
jgi:phospholipid-binding lipoprotein MlaA